jgi:Phage integrase, N-terminal SAM-like domain
MAKGNRPGHRRFGNVRRIPSGRYQASYLGPDGQRRDAPDTFERKSDAERALVMIEAQLSAGQWTDPERGKVRLAEYAATWIAQRPGLRPRSADNYQWLLKKHITPRLGGVPVGKLSTPMIREWRAALLDQGVSVSTAAKAYRLLRAVLMTAVDEDKILSSNPCRIRGAGDEQAPERPVLTVAQVFELAERVGRRPFGNIRQIPGNRYRLRFRRDGRCARCLRSTAAGPKRPRRCGRWRRMAGRTAITILGTGRWCCSRRSLACAGVR